MMIRVAVLDDHKIFVKSFMLLLKHINDKHEFQMVIQEVDQESVIQESKQFDLIIMDLELQDKSGLELIPELKLDNANLRILVLSMHTSDKVIKDALKKGADGYLSKKTNEAELVKAIQQVMDGEVFLGEDINLITNQITTTRSKPRVNLNRFNAKQNLTIRELEILDLITKGMTNKAMAAQLYISVETVSVHRKNLMKKLEVTTAIGLIKIANEYDLT